MAKAKTKTQPSKTTVSSFLKAIDDDDRRRDCKAIAKLLKEVSGKRPIMWGTSIVSYGTYHYKYASGRGGDISSCRPSVPPACASRSMGETGVRSFTSTAGKRQVLVPHLAMRKCCRESLPIRAH